MNWLAHLLLSEPSHEFRLGNLLPDFLKAPSLQEVPSQFQRGIACHRRIDAFTDNHPIFRQSKRRIRQSLSRHAGIVVDVFYDHLLCREWHRHSPVPVENLIAELYTAIDTVGALIPSPALERLEQLRAEEWLSSYGEIAGVRRVLQRMSKRLKRPVALGDAVDDLQEHYDGFLGDFRCFFPELRAHLDL